MIPAGIFELIFSQRHCPSIRARLCVRQAQCTDHSRRFGWRTQGTAGSCLCE